MKILFWGTKRGVDQFFAIDAHGDVTRHLSGIKMQDLRKSIYLSPGTNSLFTVEELQDSPKQIIYTIARYAKEADITTNRKGFVGISTITDGSLKYSPKDIKDLLEDLMSFYASKYLSSHEFRLSDEEENFDEFKFQIIRFMAGLHPEHSSVSPQKRLSQASSQFSRYIDSDPTASFEIFRHVGSKFDRVLFVPSHAVNSKQMEVIASVKRLASTSDLLDISSPFIKPVPKAKPKAEISPSERIDRPPLQEEAAASHKDDDEFYKDDDEPFDPNMGKEFKATPNIEEKRKNKKAKNSDKRGKGRRKKSNSLNQQKSFSDQVRWKNKKTRITVLYFGILLVIVGIFAYGYHVKNWFQTDADTKDQDPLNASNSTFRAKLPTDPLNQQENTSSLPTARSSFRPFTDIESDFEFKKWKDEDIEEFQCSNCGEDSVKLKAFELHQEVYKILNTTRHYIYGDVNELNRSHVPSLKTLARLAVLTGTKFDRGLFERLDKQLDENDIAFVLINDSDYKHLHHVTTKKTLISWRDLLFYKRRAGSEDIDVYFEEEKKEVPDDEGLPMKSTVRKGRKSQIDQRIADTNKFWNENRPKPNESNEEP